MIELVPHSSGKITLDYVTEKNFQWNRKFKKTATLIQKVAMMKMTMTKVNHSNEDKS